MVHGFDTDQKNFLHPVVSKLHQVMRHGLVIAESAATMQTLKTQKKNLRKNLRSTLHQLPLSAVHDQSQSIASQVLALPALKQASAVSCYLSMPSGEVQTGKITEAILAAGKSLFVPKIQTADGIMDFVRVYSPEDLASLPNGTWGIPEPGDFWGEEKRKCILESAERLDIVLVPGLGFDHTLSRLGHGKGYYDRFISSYVASGRPKPLLIGLGLREQILTDEPIPMGEHDWKLDRLITPDEIVIMPQGQPVSGPYEGHKV